MTYNFDAYLNSVKRNIKNKKLHATICAELESHLQDSSDFYVEIGYDEETANRKALEDMGEPTTVGESMAKLHKLSGWQKFLFSGFLFVAVLKFLDIFSVLATCSTPQFNLEAPVKGVGYTRKFRECFIVDKQGDFVESILVIEYISGFINDDLDKYEANTVNKYTLVDL